MFIFYYHSNRENTFGCLLSEDLLSNALKWGISSTNPIIAVSILIRSVYILNMFKRTRWTNETKWICLMWDHNIIMFISSWATSADKVFYSKHYRKNWCVLLLSFQEIMGKCIVYNVTNNPWDNPYDSRIR